MLSEKLGIRDKRELIRHLARAIKLAELGPYCHPDYCKPSENDALAFLDYWGLEEALRILETQDEERLARAIDEAWHAGAWEDYEDEC